MKRQDPNHGKKFGSKWPVPPMLLLGLGVAVVGIVAWGVFASYSGIGTIEQKRLIHGLGYFVLSGIGFGILAVMVINLAKRLLGARRSSILDRIEDRLDPDDTKS